MKVIVFEQWDKLTALLHGMAARSATATAQYAVKRVQPQHGRAHLDDRTANILAVDGGTTTVVMPDIEPSKARDFMLRVTACGANTLRFEGAEAFEGEADALLPPEDGETCVYFFTETAAGILLVARKVVKRIEMEGEG